MDTLLLVDYDITYSIICTGTVQIHRPVILTVREESGTMHTGYKLKERMPNIAGIYGVSFSETECMSRRRRMFSTTVPLFREQYRLVDNSILLLVCLGRSVEYAGPQRMHRAQRQNESLSVSVKVLIRPMIRSRKAEPIVFGCLVVNGSADVL
jgi:hypothetical protein